MVSFFQIILLSILFAICAISLCLIIVHLITGLSTELSSLQFSAIVLFVGLLAQYLFNGYPELSAFISNALAFAFFWIAYLDGKRQNGGFVLKGLPLEEGARLAGQKGVPLMVLNAFVIAVPSIAFSAVWSTAMQLAPSPLCGLVLG